MTSKRPRNPAEPQPQPLDLGPTLNFLSSVWRLNHCLERASKRMETKLGVTAQQRMIVRVLGRYPGITPGQVARTLWVDAGTLSAALKRLEGRGLVRRERDGGDRRRVLLYLTDQGLTYDHPMEESVEAAVDAALRNEPPEAQTEVRRFVDALAFRINAVADPGEDAESV